MFRKQKTRAWLLSLAALVLLLSNYFVGWAEEPDPRILWVNKELYKIGGFVVHPNGNVIAYGLASIYDKATGIFEIDGKDGKLIKVLPYTQHISNFEQMDISYDGRYIVTPGVNLYDLQKNTLEKLEINSGNFVTFLPNQHKIANVSGGTVGNNSSIIIYDIDTKNKVNIKTDEAIRNIAFSPDGKYFATAGVKEDLGGKFYTTLKLWDAQTLKMIKELKRYNSNMGDVRIKFTNDNKFVSINANTDLIFFSIPSGEIYKSIYKNAHYDFLNDSLYVFYETNNYHIIINNYINQGKQFDLGQYYINNDLCYSKTNNTIIFDFWYGSDPFYNGIICFDLTKILSGTNESLKIDDISVEYRKGELKIKNLHNISFDNEIKIVDLNGKIFYERKGIQAVNSNININIELANGFYLLNIIDKNKSISYKFIVTE